MSKQLDSCPYCEYPLAIEAVSFKMFKPCRALFVCAGCGFANGENDAQPTRRLHSRLVQRLGKYVGRSAILPARTRDQYE
jgi:hypothetical protein